MKTRKTMVALALMSMLSLCLLVLTGCGSGDRGFDSVEEAMKNYYLMRSESYSDFSKCVPQDYEEWALDKYGISSDEAAKVFEESKNDERRQEVYNSLKKLKITNTTEISADKSEIDDLKKRLDIHDTKFDGFDEVEGFMEVECEQELDGEIDTWSCLCFKYNGKWYCKDLLRVLKDLD